MSQATVKVEVAFATDPGDPSPTWVDISAYVLMDGLTISRGRQRELDQVEAGTASYTLLNTGRRFDPTNAGAIVNLISNPSIETNTTGWLGLLGTETLTRVSSEQKYGAWSLSVDLLSPVTIEGAYVNVPVTAGTTYVFSTWFKSAGSGWTIAATQGGTGAARASANFTATGAWQRVSLAVTAQGGDTSLNLIIRRQLVGLATVCYLDGAQLEVASAATDYCDGTIDNCRWAGTAHASQSYRGGPYYPNVVPMRRCRIKATHNAVEYPLFDGYIERWPQEWSTDGRVTATVEVVDGFELLSTFYLDTIPGTLTTTFTLAGVAQFPPNATISNASPAVVTRTAHGRSAGDKIAFDTTGVLPAPLEPYDVDDQRYYVLAAGMTADTFQISLTPGGAAINTSTAGSGTHGYNFYPADDDANLLFTSKPGVYGGWISVTFALAEDPANTDAGVSLDTGTLPEEQQIIFRLPIDPTTSLPYSVTAAEVLRRVNEHSGVLGLVTVELVGDGSNFVEVMAKTYLGGGEYTPELSSSRLNAVLNDASWPAGQRAFDTGDVSVDYAAFGPLDEVSALKHIQEVVQAEAGLFFMSADGDAVFQKRTGRASSPYTVSQGTFGPADIPYSAITPEYSKDLIYNIVSITRNKGEKQEVSDSASIDRYRPRMLRLAPGYLASDADAATLAAALLAAYKDPHLRFEQLTFSPGDSVAAYAQALGREISDRITVKYQPGGVGTAITQACHIESVGHSFDGVAWWTTWQLSPAA